MTNQFRSRPAISIRPQRLKLAEYISRTSRLRLSFVLRRLRFRPLPQARDPLLVGTTEVLLREQAIVRTAQQPKVLERRETPERVSLLVMQLQESATWAAMALPIDIRALEAVTHRNGSPDLVWYVLAVPCSGCLR